MAARIDLAVAMEERQLVPGLLDLIESLPLAAAERESLRLEFPVLADLGIGKPG